MKIWKSVRKKDFLKYRKKKCVKTENNTLVEFRAPSLP